MMTQNYVKIGSGDALSPGDIKPLPEPIFTYHQFGPVT